MRAPEIAARLGEKGAKSQSKNPTNVLHVLLAQGKEFKRVGTGLYRLA